MFLFEWVRGKLRDTSSGGVESFQVLVDLADGRQPGVREGWPFRGQLLDRFPLVVTGFLWPSVGLA